MEFAYLDESGDLGDPKIKGSSKKLIMCLVCTRQAKKLNKIIRKTKQRLLRKKKTADWLNRRGGEIKFYSFPDKDILIKTLKEISKVDIKIYYICLNKTGKVDIKFKEIIMGSLFWHIFEKSNKVVPKKVISDLDFLGNIPSYFSLENYQRKKVKKLNKDGKEIGMLASDVSFKKAVYEDYKLNQKNKDKLLVKVEPIRSGILDELQAVDIICGSIFQYKEKNNPEFFNIIKKKIVMGNKI